MRRLVYILILLPLTQVYTQILQLADDRVYNISETTLYNLEVKTSSTKQFYSVLQPGDSIPAPFGEFVVSYTYLDEDRYITQKQNFKRETSGVNILTLDDEVDNSQSYWYDDNTYILILTSKQPLTYTILPTITQAVEEENTETVGEKNTKDVKIKYVHIISDFICSGQTTKFNTKRAVFLLKTASRKDFYTVLCRVEKKGVSRIIHYNIPAKI